jgi:hypothetical protein
MPFGTFGTTCAFAAAIEAKDRIAIEMIRFHQFAIEFVLLILIPHGHARAHPDWPSHPSTLWHGDALRELRRIPVMVGRGGRNHPATGNGGLRGERKGCRAKLKRRNLDESLTEKFLPLAKA